MALADDVALRIPATLLVELTNPRDNTGTSQDATLLAQACSSIQTRFAIYAQETYDSGNDYHVELCVHGVVGLLQMWGGEAWRPSLDFWEWFKGECDAYKAVGPRARITPATNSPLTPSNEDIDTSQTIRPWSDDQEFYDIFPRRGGALDDLND